MRSKFCGIEKKNLKKFVVVHLGDFHFMKENFQASFFINQLN